MLLHSIKAISNMLLKDIAVILAKANLAIQTLEKYKIVLQQSINDLGLLEFEDMVTYTDLLQVLHRYIMVLRIKIELVNYLNELGTEGRLIRLQMNELLFELESEGKLIVKDYVNQKEDHPQEIIEKLHELAQQEKFEEGKLLKVLGYNGYIHLDETISPRGYRILHKIPRLPFLIVENLINQFSNFITIYQASVEELDDVEGIGEVRANKIQEGLRASEIAACCRAKNVSRG